MQEGPQSNTRNSYMGYSGVYFWTSTIYKWNRLLQHDEFKLIIIRSLQWLCQRKLITLYGYVIMPNHVHFIWEQLGKNGKENPKGSFGKFTAHQFQSRLKEVHPAALSFYRVNSYDRKYTFWQRDPLAIFVFSREMAWQKLNYIHNNPLQQHWRLSTEPAAYRFSSARFYQTGEDEFGILSHLDDRF